MTALEDAAREMAELTRRVEQLETLVRSSRGEKPGPPRTAYKVREVAEMIGKKPRTVLAMIAAGRLVAEDMGGWYAVPASAVDELVQRRAS